MIDKATYNALAQQLEAKLYEGSRISWHVFCHDERLGEACISEETAKEMGTTPDAHFDFIYEQMMIAFSVRIGARPLHGCLPVACRLIEDGLDHVAIIKNFVAEEIARQLVEQNVV